MELFTASLIILADASAASTAMRAYIMPVVGSIIAIASVAVVFFLINGGIQYMTSAGNPEKLEYAKKVIRNALIGLVMIIGAATLTAILSQAYSSSGNPPTSTLPTLQAIETPENNGGLTDVLINAIVGLLRSIIETAAKPFISALDYFTNATPLMAQNSSVFNLWLAIVGITDVLFILVVALLGFHIMSFATFGLDEIEFKHMLPQLGLIFLLINTSIFAIDSIISLSNGMISALQAGFNSQSVWDALTSVVNQQGGLGLAALLIMVVFVILSVMLLIYYVVRLIVLYIGAVLSPLVFLVWLLPGFKGFAESAMKTYLMTVFVLFIHVVILQLAASIFSGMTVTNPNQALNPMMSMIVGVATILALLKTQSVMAQMSYVNLGTRTASKLGGQLTNVISHYGSKSGRSGRHNSSSSTQNTTRTMPGSRSSSHKMTNSTNYSNTTRRAPDMSNRASKKLNEDYPIAAPIPKPRSEYKPKKEVKK